MEMEVRWSWKLNFGSLSSYGGVGHHMMEHMGWQVGSRLGKQYSWQRVWRPVQATSYSGRTGIRCPARHITLSSQGRNAEPLRRRHNPLVFVGSSVQLSAKAAALAAAQIACRCLSLSRTMARYQARVRSGLAAMAACQAAAITMVAVRQAAECAAVMTAAEAACAARTALQWMGAALAPLVEGVHGRRRRRRLRAWYQYRWQAVEKIKQKVLCSAMEGDCNGCVSQSCPAGEGIVVLPCSVWLRHSATSEL